MQKSNLFNKFWSNTVSEISKSSLFKKNITISISSISSSRSNSSTYSVTQLPLLSVSPCDLILDSHADCFMDRISIFPSNQFSAPLIRQGHGEAEANPRWLLKRGGVHRGQLSSLWDVWPLESLLPILYNV